MPAPDLCVCHLPLSVQFWACACGLCMGRVPHLKARPLVQMQSVQWQMRGGGYPQNSLMTSAHYMTQLRVVAEVVERNWLQSQADLGSNLGFATYTAAVLREALSGSGPQPFHGDGNNHKVV